MLDRQFASPRPWLAPWQVIAAHLAIVGLGGGMLASSSSPWVGIVGSIAVGTSLFALTGLMMEASQPHRAHRRSWTDLVGRVAGWPLLVPFSAYRGFLAAHLAATNEVGDPHRALNARGMLAWGAIRQTVLIHRHALRNLRGVGLGWYLLETGAMIAVGALVLASRPWLVVGPLVVLVTWDQMRIVTEHLDLGAGRFADTWQLALPAPLSRWLLHRDHHLEHHLRPALRWHELPVSRAEISRGGFVAAERRVTARSLARVVLRPAPVILPGADPVPPPPRWAGRAAIRARPRQPEHPDRESVG